MPLALGVCKVVALVVVQRETKLALISAEQLLPAPPAGGNIGRHHPARPHERRDWCATRERRDVTGNPDPGSMGAAQ